MGSKLLIHLCVLSTYQDQAHGWYALNGHSIELNTVKNFPFTHPTQLWIWTIWTFVLRHVLDSRMDFRQPFLCWELQGKGILKSSLSSSPFLWMWRPRKRNRDVLHMVNILMVAVTSMTNFLLPRDDREGRLSVFPSAEQSSPFAQIFSFSFHFLFFFLH